MEASDGEEEESGFFFALSQPLNCKRILLKNIIFCGAGVSLAIFI
ncbi:MULTISPECIES: hypothetical protein [unclassified Nostoc]|nr:hypothetical protein [Nostoc sp. 'Peltigera membranacea cyanobiont' 232]